jgi:hypothetical protein
MSFTNTLENSILNHLLRNTAWTTPGANVHVGLITVVTNGEAGTVTEPSGNGYARVNVAGTGAWNAPAGAGTDNTGTITFPAASGAGWGEILAAGIWDAASAGNLLAWGWLGTQRYAFTAAAATEILNAPGSAFANGDRVVVRAVDDSVLPTGLTADTVYFVVGASGATFQLALTSGGAAINLTADGAGLVMRINPRTVLAGDTFTFGAGNLDVILD